MEVPSPKCPEQKIQDRVDELIGFIDAGKVIKEKSRGEVSLMEQDTIENVF